MKWDNIAVKYKLKRRSKEISCVQVNGLTNIISSYWSYALLLRYLKYILTVQEWLCWQLDGCLQIVEMCYRPLQAQGSS